MTLLVSVLEASGGGELGDPSLREERIQEQRTEAADSSSASTPYPRTGEKVERRSAVQGQTSGRRAGLGRCNYRGQSSCDAKVMLHLRMLFARLIP